jgi:uncharacterized membrane protein
MPGVNSANLRLVATAVAGAVFGSATGLVAVWQIGVLTGWCTGAAAFLLLVAREVAGSDAAQTRATATREDVSHVLADATLIAAAAASLVGVGFALVKASQYHGVTRAGVAGLGAVSVGLAWVTVQTIYMLRYARLYYDANDDGGVDFGGEAPDYHDFAYLAFTIGMTWQVSDTAITRRELRRTVLRHALLSFLFSTAFIAVLINVVGGLL